MSERFRIWCGAAWSEHGWQWHWDVIDTKLRPFDRRVSAPGVVARGWQPSWQRAMEAAAAHREHIIAWRTDLAHESPGMSEASPSVTSWSTTAR